MSRRSRGKVTAGASDCERHRSGALGQPMNTLSAAAFIAGGALIARRGGPRDRVLGGAVAATGLGTAAYHGPGGRFAVWAHDATLLTVLVFVALENLAALEVGSPQRARWRVPLALLPALISRRGPGGPATAACATAAALTELRCRQSGRHPPSAARALADGSLAVGLAAYLAGRTGSRLCRPDSLLQAHALWHVCSAVAVAAWARSRQG